MPYYGDAQLARTAVESVLAQSSQEWRLVVVDDLAPDPTLGRWLRSLDHPKVEYHRNEQNLGVNGNFRRCAQHLQAPYATFLGCDDVLGREYVSLIHQAIRRHGRPAMIQPRVEIIDEAGDRSLTLIDAIKSLLSPAAGERIVTGEQAAVRLLHGAWTYFPAICWRGDALERHPFRSGLDTALDLQLILDVLLDGESLIRLDEVAFYYRRHKQSASVAGALSSTRFEEEARLFRDLARVLDANGWHKASRAARMHTTSRLYALVTLGVALRSHQPSVARRLLRHAVGWQHPRTKTDEMPLSASGPAATEVS